MLNKEQFTTKTKLDEMWEKKPTHWSAPSVSGKCTDFLCSPKINKKMINRGFCVLLNYNHNLVRLWLIHQTAIFLIQLK